MNTIANITASIIAILMLFIPAIERAQLPKTGYETSFSSLGNPLTEYYPSGIAARSIWAIKHYDDKLFIACGDYDVNAGPVPVMHYDLLSGQWVDNGTVEDEQLASFHIINGMLMSPGIDPREDWSFGNIYVYDSSGWHTRRTIPSGIHCFDIIEFEGKLFAATGTVPGLSTLWASEDNGQTFQEVPMYKEGKLINTSILPEHPEATPMQIRSYDFFTLDNTLYAFYFGHFDMGKILEIYKYEKDSFVFHSNLPEQLKFNRISYDILCAKAEYNGSVYLSTGNLYHTEDMAQVKQIDFGTDSAVSDLKVINNQLFASVIHKESDGSYRNSIWVNDGSYPDSFRELFYFHFTCPIQSMEYHSNTFYFGMGAGILSEINEDNGTVLTVSYNVFKKSVE